MGLFDTIFQFNRELETSDPPERGIRHVTLRQLVLELGRVLVVIRCLDDADEEAAKVELMDRRTRSREAIRVLDGLLSAQNAPQETVLAEAIRIRFSVQLDKILTASSVRLPADLHRHSIDARTIRERHEAYRSAWVDARERLLEQLHKLRGSVASLGFAYEQRRETGEHARACDELLKDLRLCINTLDTTEPRCEDEVKALLSLHEKAQALSEQARGIISALNALSASARTLDILIPNDICAQIRETQERLESVLENMRDDFSDLPAVDRDPTLLDAIQEVGTLEARKDQILHPIRPSVFTNPLERSEEVRRLTLIALSHCTDRNDPFKKTERHRGLGKHAVPDILKIADLIDGTELETAADAIFAMHKSGEGLVEQVKAGLFWKYRTTKPGNDQAREWSEESISASGLFKRIEEARIERNRLIRKQRFSAIEQSSASAV